MRHAVNSSRRYKHTFIMMIRRSDNSKPVESSSMHSSSMHSSSMHSSSMHSEEASAISPASTDGHGAQVGPAADAVTTASTGGDGGPPSVQDEALFPADLSKPPPELKRLLRYCAENPEVQNYEVDELMGFIAT